MKSLKRIVLALALVPCIALAQVFPSKPLKLIVPFPAGGPADLFGRLLAQHMGDQLGQTVVVENVGGVGGTLGVDRAAKATPDGYTLVLNSGSTVSIAPFSMTNLPYDVKKDLAFISTVVLVPEVLVVNPSLPVNSLKELVAHAKANPGKVNFASAGGGTVTHLAGELLKVEAGINIIHVPYKGAAPAVTDMLGGQVQMGVFDVPVLLAHIKAGKLKPLAVTTARRTPTLPDVPTTGELGYPKVISDNWYGLIGAAAIPASIRKRLNTAAVTALRQPALVEQYQKVAGIPVPSTPEEYVVFVAAEQAKWSKVVAAIGFKQN
jgi:tripartite-type tricarboxylate transporter receptor subunit TctC